MTVEALNSHKAIAYQIRQPQGDYGFAHKENHLLRQTPDKNGLKARRWRAAWENDYRLKVLAGPSA